jgi:hypothetical protein
MDEHFADLFARYAEIAPTPVYQQSPAACVASPELALAHSAARTL